jgi:hypothetical protein
MAAKTQQAARRPIRRPNVPRSVDPKVAAGLLKVLQAKGPASGADLFREANGGANPYNKPGGRGMTAEYQKSLATLKFFEDQEVLTRGHTTDASGAVGKSEFFNRWAFTDAAEEKLREVLPEVAAELFPPAEKPHKSQLPPPPLAAARESARGLGLPTPRKTIRRRATPTGFPAHWRVDETGLSIVRLDGVRVSVVVPENISDLRATVGWTVHPLDGQPVMLTQSRLVDALRAVDADYPPPRWLNATVAWEDAAAAG